MDIVVRKNMCNVQPGSRAPIPDVSDGSVEDILARVSELSILLGLDSLFHRFATEDPISKKWRDECSEVSKIKAGPLFCRSVMPIEHIIQVARFDVGPTALDVFVKDLEHSFEICWESLKTKCEAFVKMMDQEECPDQEPHQKSGTTAALSSQVPSGRRTPTGGGATQSMASGTFTNKYLQVLLINSYEGNVSDPVYPGAASHVRASLSMYTSELNQV
ncbi:hypothetical protein QFC20_007253 [Naganishia adeliensis]|uniref:Uncharacterized protein n=1 Tax=Naganishia adeliensis TaxID=92952 RepID=A0ACC2V1S0_9TREE|nr:hypothetical protein QFC20_007253 [Naganishia adeliensis]